MPLLPCFSNEETGRGAGRNVVDKMLKLGLKQIKKDQKQITLSAFRPIISSYLFNPINLKFVLT